jgi:hypothetical protein
MSERVDGVSIFVGGCGDVCCGSLSSLTMGWIGLDWVWMCNAMRSDAERYDTNTTRDSGQHSIDER